MNIKIVCIARSNQKGVFFLNNIPINIQDSSIRLLYSMYLYESSINSLLDKRNGQGKFLQHSYVDLPC